MPGENWTVLTTMYWATRDCETSDLANATRTYSNGSSKPSLFFTNGADWSLELGGPIRNLSVSEDLYGPAFYNLNLTASLYPSQQGTDEDEIELSRPISTTEHFFVVLYQYLTNGSTPDYMIYPKNARPVFCRPKYWSAPIETVITLESNHSTVVNWTMRGPQEPLIFNTTLLHRLWTYGVFDTSQLYRGEQSIIHSTNWAGGARLEYVASWVFALAEGNFEELLDNDSALLWDTFNRTLNNLFAFAMQDVLQNPDSAGWQLRLKAAGSSSSLQ